MKLLFAELRKVWGNRVFSLLLVVLAATNLLLLWMGTRPSGSQPPAAAYRTVAQDIAGMNMAEKGEFLHSKFAEIDSLLKISQYYQTLAYGGNALRQYHNDNAAMFDQYEQEYTDKSYDLYTDNLTIEYHLFSQLQDEYDTVAGYGDFLDSVQNKASQLSGISIFQKDQTGYDLKNIELTAQVYAGLRDTTIDYTPQKGLYTAISYAFTDLLSLAAMLLLALVLIRQERDSGLLGLVRSLPSGRLKTALAKLGAFAVSLLAVLVLLYGVNLAYCSASYGVGALNRTIQSVPALMRSTMQITVGQYLLRFLLAKWVGAFVMGLWVMLAALLARRTAAGCFSALAMPLAMYGIRSIIPATARFNVLKYANLASLLQTNELLGNYRNLYWFGEPVGLPLIEWLAAALFGASFFMAFCAVFTRAQLLPYAQRSVVLNHQYKTRPTSIWREEGRKLLIINGVSIFLVAFLTFGCYQGATSESYIDENEIYYSYYMKHLSGPFTLESKAWLEDQSKEFTPLLAMQSHAETQGVGNDSMVPYGALQQKYAVFKTIMQENLTYLTENSGAWLVYESGYRKLFGFSGTSDIQDALFAGLLCALCFSGLFAMERKGGMDEILLATPRGRRFTVQSKLGQSALIAVAIALITCLPHLWQVLRDYGLPAIFAPAYSIQEFSTVPHAFTLSDILLFWMLCRIAACLCMEIITLWLGQMFGNMLPTLFVSATCYCLPALLSLSGMENGIEWLGAYPLFHAAALLKTEGTITPDIPYSYSWAAILLLALALLLTWFLAQILIQKYEWTGVDFNAKY